MMLVISDGTAERNEADQGEVGLYLLESEIQVYPVGVNVELLTRFTDSLDRYAELTGGRLVYTDSESLQSRYAEIAGQARNQYIVTYVSNNPIPENEIPFRRIEIQTAHPYEIDHRRGYYQVP